MYFWQKNDDLDGLGEGWPEVQSLEQNSALFTEGGFVGDLDSSRSF